MRLPVGSGTAFVERYAQLPEDQRVSLVYHQVKKGDTPGTLARRYGVRSDDILRFNKLKNARALRIGQNLLIPLNPEAGNMSLGLAMDAMVVATHAILQAEVAILKAFTSRKTVFDMVRIRSDY